MIYYILLVILINLCILNLLILDFIEILTNLELKINNINNILNNNLNNLNYLNNNVNNNVNNNANNNVNNNVNNNLNNCILNCTIELDKIIYYYNNLTPYKNIYKMMPVKNEKKNNNQCIILYYNIPVLNNKYNKTNMYKDKRIFTFKYYNSEDNYCISYITTMSDSIWGKNK